MKGLNLWGKSTFEFPSASPQSPQESTIPDLTYSINNYESCPSFHDHQPEGLRYNELMIIPPWIMNFHDLSSKRRFPDLCIIFPPPLRFPEGRPASGLVPQLCLPGLHLQRVSEPDAGRDLTLSRRRQLQQSKFKHHNLYGVKSYRLNIRIFVLVKS